MEPGHSRHTRTAPAYDVILRDSTDGHILRSDNPADRTKMGKYIESAARTPMGSGIGHGPNYMGESGIHVGGGAPSVWGAGGRGGNEPEWVRKAWERGRKAGMTPAQIKTAIADYNKKQTDPQARNPDQKSAEDKPATQKQEGGKDLSPSLNLGGYKRTPVKVNAENRSDYDVLYDKRPLANHDSDPSPSSNNELEKEEEYAD
jgi:hypothetical protein